MGIKLNLTGDEIKAAQGGSFPPLNEGIYGAVIYESDFKKSKAGNDMYALNFKLLEGPDAVAGKNRQVRAWFTLTPKALFKVVELNKAVGFPYPTKETPAGEFEFNDADDYLGIKVNLQIIQEPYESVEDVLDEDPESPTYGETIEKDVTAYRNNVKKVLKYDEDKIGGGEEAVDSGLFLS